MICRWLHASKWHQVQSFHHPHFGYAVRNSKDMHSYLGKCNVHWKKLYTSIEKDMTWIMGMNLFSYVYIIICISSSVYNIAPSTVVHYLEIIIQYKDTTRIRYIVWGNDRMGHGFYLYLWNPIFFYFGEFCCFLLPNLKFDRCFGFFWTWKAFV